MIPNLSLLIRVDTSQDTITVQSTEVDGSLSFLSVHQQFWSLFFLYFSLDSSYTYLYLPRIMVVPFLCFPLSSYHFRQDLRCGGILPAGLSCVVRRERGLNDVLPEARTKHTQGCFWLPLTCRRYLLGVTLIPFDRTCIFCSVSKKKERKRENKEWEWSLTNSSL